MAKIFEKLSNKVIGCAIEVHKHLGPGLLESVYQTCLEYELKLNQINFKKELTIPIRYKNVIIDNSYRIDLLVEDSLILELKSVKNLENIYSAQLLTYMKIMNVKTGLLINFNTTLLKHGIKRFVLE